MGKSSIHIMAVKAGSESHNQRLQNLNYVREDLSYLNSSFVLASIADTRKQIETRYQESTGQKMQAKQTPIREGVLLIDEKHNADDLKRVAKQLEERFGIQTIQAYAHKDEGHRNKETGEWKPNYHAHMVFDWTEKNTGKSLKLKREDLAEVQTIVAETLGLERGQASTKRHIQSREFKVLKIEEEIKNIKKEVGILENGKKKGLEIDKIEVRKMGGLFTDYEKTNEEIKKHHKQYVIEAQKTLSKEQSAFHEKERLTDAKTNALIKRIDNYVENPSHENKVKVKYSSIDLKITICNDFEKPRLNQKKEELSKEIVKINTEKKAQEASISKTKTKNNGMSF